MYPIPETFSRFHQVDDMPDAGIDEGGQFDGSFFRILCAGIEAGKEFSWDTPLGTGEGDW
jgi:hypothetical protein